MEQLRTKVEAAVSATASGNLTWDRWPLDAATALALAGVRNPIGFAVVRYLSENNVSALFGLQLALATQLIRLAGLDGRRANEVALQAIEFWNNRRCPRCNGTGEDGRHVCAQCGGSGDIPVSRADRAIQQAVGLLLSAEDWMESQLRRRLKGSQDRDPTDGDGRRLMFQRVDKGSDFGTNELPEAKKGTTEK